MVDPYRPPGPVGLGAGFRAALYSADGYRLLGELRDCSWTLFQTRNSPKKVWAVVGQIDWLVDPGPFYVYRLIIGLRSPQEGKWWHGIGALAVSQPFAAFAIEPQLKAT